MMGKQALLGLRVVEYANLVSGPYCAKLLGDFGAEVIKIEPVIVGDESRRRGPFLHNVPHAERSALFLYLNTNKLGITLNPKTKTGKEIFKRLIEGADILVENQPPRVMQELGLEYEILKEVSPRLIMTSITPFGQTGPYRDYKSYYLNNFHAGGEGYCLPGGKGWRAHPHRAPVKAGGYIGEYDAAITAAFVTLAAVYNREFTGLGERVDISQQEVLVSLMRHELSRYNEGWVETRAVRSLPVGGLMQCKDGFVQLHPHEQRMWEGMIEFLGNPDWGRDERYQIDRLMSTLHHADPAQEKELAVVQEEANDLIEQSLVDYTKEEIYYGTQANKCACGIVSTMEDLLKINLLRARDFFVRVFHPQAGEIAYPGAPFKLPETPWRIEHAAPLLGEHNEKVYCEWLGYTKQELLQLRRAGII